MAGKYHVHHVQSCQHNIGLVCLNACVCEQAYNRELLAHNTRHHSNKHSANKSALYIQCVQRCVSCDSHWSCQSRLSCRFQPSAWPPSDLSSFLLFLVGLAVPFLGLPACWPANWADDEGALKPLLPAKEGLAMAFAGCLVCGSAASSPSCAGPWSFACVPGVWY